MVVSTAEMMDETEMKMVDLRVALSGLIEAALMVSSLADTSDGMV